jgi:glycosyltransferase involved in cell wall biosynthesis
MSANNPLVSVIIPTYNRADVVGRSIRSVLNQSHENFNILIVDDGSTDSTEEVVKSFDDDRITYIYQKNQGANTARNRGIKIAEGDYISFLDSDDVFYPDYLSRSIGAISNASSRCIGSATASIFYSSKKKTRSRIPEKELSLENFQGQNPIGSFSATTFHVTVRDKVGLLDETLPSLQDYDYYLRVAKEYTIVGINDVLVKRYADTDNRISDSIRRKKKGQEQITRKHGDIIQDERLSTNHINLGILYMKQGEKKKAREAFRTGIKLAPTNKSAVFYYFLSLTGTKIFDIGSRTKDQLFYLLRS